MEKDHIIITWGRFQPPTSGHHAMVQTVKDLADKHGAHHAVFTFQKHGDEKNPLPPDVKEKWMRVILGTDNVFQHEDIKTPGDVFQLLHDKGYKKITVVAGGARAQEYEDQFTKYFGQKTTSKKTGRVLDLTNIHRDNFKVHAIERDADSDQGEVGIESHMIDPRTNKMRLPFVSGSRMREAAVNDSIHAFMSMLPSHVTIEQGKALQKDLKSFGKKNKLQEEVSVKTRIKLSRAARRTAPRRKIVRRMREKRRKNLPQLKKRAVSLIRNALRERVFKGNWKNLPLSSRANIDKQINRNPKLITTMVRKILPKVMKGESERLKNLSKKNLKESMNPVLNNFFSNYISEAKTPRRAPKTGEEKLKRKTQNRNNQRTHRSRESNAIKSGDVKNKVMVVKNNKTGRIEIIDKDSYDKSVHEIKVDAKNATVGAVQKFLNDKAFANTDTSIALFGKVAKGAGGAKEGKTKKSEKPKAKSEKKEKEKGPSKEQKSAQKQMMPQEPGEWDLEQGTIEPKRKQSKNCSLPTSHDAKIVEPAMAVFANAANGIDFKKQVEMGLVDEGVMKAILKSPHKSLHESAQRMGNALVNHYGQRVYFKVVGSKLEDVKLSKKAEEGGLTNKTSKADVHIFSADTNELIDTASVKCGASQASSGNWQDSTVGLQWTLDNANNFGISLPKYVVKEVEDLISFISDPNEYAGNEVTARGPTNLYKARGAFAGQDPTFTKKEKANKTLTEKMNKLFKKSPEVLALYALTQMTGFHKFEENSTAIARSMIAVSHDGTQVKIGQIDLDLAKKLKIDVASRIKSSSAASKAQELEWDNLQEQAKKSGKTLTDADDFRPYGYRNTIRTVINEVDLRTLKENKSPLTSMSGISIFKMLTENNKKDSEFYNVGMSPEEVEQNLKDLKEISKEDPMQVFQIVNSAFDYDDISPKVDFLDLLPTEGYTVNRVYVNGKEFRIPVEMPYDYPVPGMQVPQVSLEEQNLFERNYRKEYDNYHSKPEQRKNRSKRVLARRLMMKLGRVKKGDGKDVDHKDGNPRNNGKHNLRVRSKSENRADND
jgi:hypothetical protein